MLSQVQDKESLSPHKESTSDLQVLLCNPFTLMSNQDRASPYIISTIPSQQATRVNKYINEGILDPILNSPNWHFKNCMADSRENC